MKIENKFDYKCTPQQLYDAIVQRDSITRWWTDQCDQRSTEMTFHWAPQKWRVVIKTVKLLPNEYVEWLCVDSNMQDTDAWKGSILSFRIFPKIDGTTALHFLHDNYKSSPCFSECSAGWAFVLGKSLKNYLENGEGRPFKSQ